MRAADAGWGAGAGESGIAGGRALGRTVRSAVGSAPGSAVGGATGSALGSAIGTPLPHLSVHVLDAGGELAPIGVPGELAVGGAGVARGYLGRPELTAERFVPDPFAGRRAGLAGAARGGSGRGDQTGRDEAGRGEVGLGGARLYRSGDLGRFLPTGELEYLGSIDHQG